MERLYEVTVEVGGYRKDRETEIIKACMVEWGFREDDFGHVPGNYGGKRLLQASALGSIYDGEEIGEIVARIERAVWRSNGGMCHVECHVSALGDVGGVRVLMPCEDTEPMIA